ncbi:MAG: DUF4838 domain-containing protein [Victivallaceae bacterium]|nr:DUF4838 domain-containing protein [Victivallaceae bacterium]
MSLFVLSGSSVNAMRIVENGKPEALIVISPAAPDSVVYAARELQTYIQKISGAKLPILNSTSKIAGKTVIFIGCNKNSDSKSLNLSELKPDGFKIVSGNNSIALYGKDYAGSPLSLFGTLKRSYSKKFKTGRIGETGTLFSVYYFLEQFCGVRWYMPGELGEVVPKRKTLEIPENLNLAISPDFEYRVLWNCDFCDDDENALWYRRAGFGAGKRYPVGHSFHLFNKYQNTNPEFFALRGGKRDFNRGIEGGNLCLSNPDLLKCFVKEAREFFNKNPDQCVFSVMPNNSFINICECSKCRKQIENSRGDTGKFSNYVWNFVNNVAKEVNKTHPDKFIGCTAYSTYLDPPTDLNKLSPNVLVMILKRSPAYWNRKAEKYIKKIICAWNEKVNPGNLICWDYYNWIYSGRQFLNVPVFFPHIISKDLKFLKGKIKGEFIEAETWPPPLPEKRKALYPGLTHLNYYVTGKLMWNANTDVDKLLEEYYYKFYGPAASEMKIFWEKAEELWMLNLPERNDNFYRKLYTEEVVGKLISCLQKAQNKCLAGSPEQKRIALLISETAPLYARSKNSILFIKPHYACQFVSSSPEIDGEPNEKFWQNNKPAELVAWNGEKSLYPSQVMVGYDDKNLYLYFKNITGGDRLKVLCRNNDSMKPPYIWDDESIEIFLRNNNSDDTMTHYQLIINADGKIWDDYFTPDNLLYSNFARYAELSQQVNKWNSNIEFAVKKGAEDWAVEMKIPFSDIGILPGKMELTAITANFIRHHPKGNSIYSSFWSPTSDNHNTARFGRLVLKKINVSEKELNGEK